MLPEVENLHGIDLRGVNLQFPFFKQVELVVWFGEFYQAPDLAGRHFLHRHLAIFHALVIEYRSVCGVSYGCGHRMEGRPGLIHPAEDSLASIGWRCRCGEPCRKDSKGRRDVSADH